MSDTEAPPAPAAAPAPPAAPPTPPPAPPPAPAGQTTTPPARRPRTPRRRGMPVEPLLVAAGNGTAMTTTAAYQVAGLGGMVGVAGAVGAVTLAAVVSRRRTVRRRSYGGAPSRLNRGGAGRRSALGSTGAPRPGGRSGSGLSGAGRGRGGSAGAGRGAGTRSGLGSRGASTRGALGALGKTGAGRGTGATGSGRHSRPGGLLGRGGKHTGRGPASNGSTSAKRPGKTARAARALTRAAAAPGSSVRRGASAAARGIRRASTATGPHLARAGRATGRGITRAGHGTWNSVLAGIAGLGTALWRRDWRAGLEKARNIWRRRRAAAAARRKTKDDAKRGAMTGPAAATAPAPIATFARRPTTPGGTTAGGTMPGGHHFIAPAMEMARIAANYDPRGMLEVGQDFAQLPEALELVAEAMKISTARADAEQPLDPRIVDMMREIHGMQLKAAELARELAPAFKKIHDVDLARLENPRKGAHAEAKWDVVNNL